MDSLDLEVARGKEIPISYSLDINLARERILRKIKREKGTV